MKFEVIYFNPGIWSHLFKVHLQVKPCLPDTSLYQSIPVLQKGWGMSVQTEVNTALHYSQPFDKLSQVPTLMTSKVKTHKLKQYLMPKEHCCFWEAQGNNALHAVNVKMSVSQLTGTHAYLCDKYHASSQDQRSDTAWVWVYWQQHYWLFNATSLLPLCTIYLDPFSVKSWINDL